MFLAQTIVTDIIHQFLELATAKAGTRNQLSRDLSINISVLSRLKAGKAEGVSARAFLAMYNYIDPEIAHKVITDTISQKANEFNTVQDYFEHADKYKKLQPKKA